jgi:hypothetical protein
MNYLNSVINDYKFALQHEINSMIEYADNFYLKSRKMYFQLVCDRFIDNYLTTMINSISTEIINCFKMYTQSKLNIAYSLQQCTLVEVNFNKIYKVYSEIERMRAIELIKSEFKEFTAHYESIFNGYKEIFYQLAYKTKFNPDEVKPSIQ